MRTFRTLALGATLLALIVGACSSGGGSPSPAAPSVAPESSAPSEPAAESPSAPAGPALSTTLKLGGPPECPERPFCLLGLKDTYGLEFAEFVPLDAGGPLTVTALTGGQVDVGLLFTSDPAIVTNNFVLLEDDKHLQLSDNIAPVVRNDLLAKAPSDFKSIINSIAPKLTTAELTAMNKQNDVDKTDPKAIAAAWLKKMGLVK
jgi:osmoprotectant transport system substrate-binding protein